VFDLDRRVADDLQKLLVVPDVILARGDVQVAHKDRPFRAVVAEPVAHLGQVVELLAELLVHRAVGHVAAGGDVEVVDQRAVFQPRRDVAAWPRAAKSSRPASSSGSFDRIATPL
jgi:hypothetical protein